MATVETICGLGVVVPVVTLEHSEDVFPVAEALLEGGMKTIEITLRTEAALPAIALLAKQNNGLTIGAGTITDALRYTDALNAGAEFLVSPGITPPLLDKAFQHSTPFLPGVSSVSESMLAQSYGFSVMKFFPAELSGGISALKYFSSVLPDIIFCPTGGINSENMQDYLALPNVACVGGSWIASKELIAAKDWKTITQNAKSALCLKS